MGSVAAADLALLSRLYDEARAMGSAARDAWMSAWPPAQAHLRAPLEKMLDPGTGQGGERTDPACATSATSATRTATDAPTLRGPRLAPASRVAAGDRIGPYVLQRELGAGGMGAVWLAERADAMPRRPVALKLPRLAWDEHLAERLARERDIVARLEHPHIARLYDAGVDEHGRPWLALAYVDGPPIDRWCADRGASVAQRVRLVLQLTQAVAYAHARLVVHRDIKPSNVLVDADGRAQLLDFGVATLLDGAGDDRLTREHGRMMTPRIAPPELLRGEPATVACDVYELGLLLHELLVGHLPERPADGRAAFDPAPPSRSAPDPALARRLRGDLDAIVGRCLRHAPAERYASADALADDLQRWLDGRPVRARDGQVGYRIGKALRRHRMAVAAGVAVVVALVSGTAVAWIEARRAEAEAARAQLVKGFVVDLFRVNQRGQPANAELRRLPAELLLERGAALVAERFPGQPELQAELHGVVAGIFADMGAHAQALAHAEHTRRALESAGAPIAAHAAPQLLAAQSLLALGRLAEAQARADAALAAVAPDDATTRAEALIAKADAQRAEGRRSDAAETLARADAWLQRPDAPPRTQARALQLRALLVDETRFEETHPLVAAAIAAAVRADGPASGLAADIRLAYAARLALHDQRERADAVFEQAVRALRDGGAAGTLRAALIEAEQSATRYMMGQRRFEAAEKVIERSRSELAALGDGVPPSASARLALLLGSTRLLHGDLERGAPLVQQSASQLRPELEALRERLLLAAFQGLAAMYAGRHDEAAVHLQERRRLRAASGGAQHPYAAFDTAYVALNLAHAGRHGEAALELQRALAATPATPANAALAPVTAHQILSHALARVRLLAGDLDGAERAQATAYASFRQLPFDAALLAAEIDCARGRAGALERLQRALAEQDGFAHPNHPELARAHGVAAQCALRAGLPRVASRHADAMHAALDASPTTGAAFRRVVSSRGDR